MQNNQRKDKDRKARTTEKNHSEKEDYNSYIISNILQILNMLKNVIIFAFEKSRNPAILCSIFLVWKVKCNI